jgi:hypothetical protein
LYGTFAIGGLSFRLLKLISGNKKSLCPQWDKDCVSAVPPKLPAEQAARPLDSHTNMCASRITGEAPVGHYSHRCFPAALLSPFVITGSAAIAPPAALLESLVDEYSSQSLVSFIYCHYMCKKNRCQEKFHFQAVFF